MVKLCTLSARWFLAFALLCLLQPAWGQTKILIGIKAGGNFSRTSQREYYHQNDQVRYGYSPDKEVDAYKYPVSFSSNLNREFGLVMNLGTDSLSFQPELLLVQKGMRATGVYSDAVGNQQKHSYEQWQNTYLEVPLLAKFAVGSERLKLFVAAGPSMGFWLDSYYNKNSTGAKSEKSTYNFEKNFLYAKGTVVGVDSLTNEPIREGTGQDSITIVENRTEVSAIIAAGMHYKLKRGGVLMLDARFVQGFTDLYKYKYERPLYTDKLTTRRIALSLSYLFSFK